MILLTCVELLNIACLLFNYNTTSLTLVMFRTCTLFEFCLMLLLKGLNCLPLNAHDRVNLISLPSLLCLDPVDGFLDVLVVSGHLEIVLWQIKISLYVCVSTPGIVCSIGSSTVNHSILSFSIL